MYLCTVNVNHTLSCTRPNKIAAKGVGVPHLVAASRCAWPRTREGPLTFYIFYTKERDKTTPARVGMNTFKRPTVPSRDLIGLNTQHAFMSQARWIWIKMQRVPREYLCTASGRSLRWVLPIGTPTRREPVGCSASCTKSSSLGL